jgi:hypothetical protein
MIKSSFCKKALIMTMITSQLIGCANKINKNDLWSSVANKTFIKTYSMSESTTTELTEYWSASGVIYIGNKDGNYIWARNWERREDQICIIDKKTYCYDLEKTNSGYNLYHEKYNNQKLTILANGDRLNLYQQWLVAYKKAYPDAIIKKYTPEPLPSIEEITKMQRSIEGPEVKSNNSIGIAPLIGLGILGIGALISGSKNTKGSEGKKEYVCESWCDADGNVDPSVGSRYRPCQCSWK